ncbi:MAG: hypothetical protein KJ052_15170 [Candidatus Hydrogenedentes bacterium]|nr:hypothetical protein [Candidatus Hydrogenedentota bacterium]
MPKVQRLMREERAALQEYNRDIRELAKEYIGKEIEDFTKEEQESFGNLPQVVELIAKFEEAEQRLEALETQADQEELRRKSGES